MEIIKQLFWSMAAILISAGILAGMVVYTVSMMRAAQMRILTGEMTWYYQSDSHR